MPGQLGEAGGLQQEGLLGLHVGLGAAAVSHGYHVVGLASSVAPRARLLGGGERERPLNQAELITEAAKTLKVV